MRPFGAFRRVSLLRKERAMLLVVILLCVVTGLIVARAFGVGR